MKINHIEIHNYKGIEQLELTLDPQLNIFIGDNGSGKTALLEALAIAAGSLFIGIKDTPPKGIGPNDVHINPAQEQSFPVTIKARGHINNQPVAWQRQRLKPKGNTTTRDAADLSTVGRALDASVRNGEQVQLPVIAYFATGRLFIEAQSRSKAIEKGKNAGSRFRGYEQSLDAKSNFKAFLKWFYLKELSGLQKGSQSLLELVRQAMVGTLPDCKNIYYDVDKELGNCCWNL